ncbi:MAG: SPASM domain-containing protein [Kiritimatiellae bacterium]|nr:SPASM domain-containing protein [Kiritimatiellia bacterium]MDD5521724.1 SPASM domain-containing protein [Kiritimatiellia bacterium]
MEIVKNNPWLIRIETTTRCNSKCNHCLHGYSDFGQDMSAEVFQKISNSLLKTAKVVDLTGLGESFLAEKLPEFVDACLRAGVHLQITTNGLLLKRSGLLPRLVKGKVELRLSLDGATPETFDFVRPNIGFGRMIEIFEYINETAKQIGISKDFHLNINFVVMKQNVADLPELVRLAGRYNVRDILLIPLSSEQNFPRMKDQSLDHSPDLFLEPYMEAVWLARRMKIGLVTPRYFINLLWASGGNEGKRNHYQRILSVFAEDPGLGVRGMNADFATPDSAKKLRALARRASLMFKMILIYLMRIQLLSLFHVPHSLWRLMSVRSKKLNMKSCTDPLNSTYIAADGSVYACCRMGETLGNLNSQSWEDVWNGPLYRNLRRTMCSWNPTEVCRHCPCWWGILEGDQDRYERYFSSFNVTDIPLKGSDVAFVEGFDPVPADAGSRWMCEKGRIVVSNKIGAKFLRLRIHSEPPGPRRISGFATINGRVKEPFDNSCPIVHLPLKCISGNRIELSLEMERNLVREGDSQYRVLQITGLQYLS